MKTSRAKKPKMSKIRVRRMRWAEWSQLQCPESVSLTSAEDPKLPVRLSHEEKAFGDKSFTRKVVTLTTAEGDVIKVSGEALVRALAALGYVFDGRNL